MPAESLKVIALQRSTDVLGQLYVLLMEKQEQAQVSKAATIINTRIVTPADMPLKPTSPKVMVTVLFGAFSVLSSALGSRWGAALSPAGLRARSRSALLSHFRFMRLYRGTPRAISRPAFSALRGHSAFSEFLPYPLPLHPDHWRTGQADGNPHHFTGQRGWQDDDRRQSCQGIRRNGKSVVLVDGDLHLSRLRGLFRFGEGPGLVDWLATGIRPEIHDWPQ